MNYSYIKNVFPNFTYKASTEFSKMTLAPPVIETMESLPATGTTDNHESVISHVSNCESCKKILFKQLHLEYVKKRDSQILELVGYIVFCILVYFLLS